MSGFKRCVLVGLMAALGAACSGSPATAISQTTEPTATTSAAPVQQTTVTAGPPELTPTGTEAAQASAAPTRTPRNMERLQATQDAATQAAAPQPTDTPTPTAVPTSGHANGACPVTQPRLTPSFGFDPSTSEEVGALYQNVLAFLNAGGSQSAVIKAYSQQWPKAVEDVAQSQDVNGDGVPDLLLTAPDSLVVFMCANGNYQDYALIGETYHFDQPVIVSVVDMNRDGIPEIIAVAGDERIRLVYVYEWSSGQFNLLNGVAPSGCTNLLGPDSWPYAIDTNGDGRLELVLKQGIPIWTEYVDGLPWRKEARTCTWNGTAFVLTKTELTSPPQFRFQAVQDGDRASLTGDYAQALNAYQQAINNTQLAPWSFERYLYESQLGRPGDGGTQTPIPLPPPDPAEYPTLAAYARYRIMLLDVVRGDLPDARAAYAALQAQEPMGQPGHAEGELATAFWNSYQASHSVAQGCASAVAYAAQHPADVLGYLGTSAYTQTPFGQQSLEYAPASICPFN